MQAGAFVISLDFELLWGVRDKYSIADYGANILGVRRVVPALLETVDLPSHLWSHPTLWQYFATGWRRGVW